MIDANGPEAESLWERFKPLDALLRSEAEQFVPGFQSGPMIYHFNDMPTDYTTSDFIAGWDTPKSRRLNLWV